MNLAVITGADGGMGMEITRAVDVYKRQVLIAVGMRFDDRVTGKLETYAKQAKRCV